MEWRRRLSSHSQLSSSLYFATQAELLQVQLTKAESLGVSDRLCTHVMFDYKCLEIVIKEGF